MKKELRKKYKALRDKYNSMEKSEIVANKFLSSSYYKDCKSVFTFLSFGSEIDTYKIVKKALEDEKMVALPYMTGKPHEMVFIKINSLYELKKNKIGILEPYYNEENIVKSDKDTIIIVPGLVFDLEGYRIGYGGGYYDKYLSENSYMLSVGLAFDFQLVDAIAFDEYDVKTDVVITDGRVKYEKLN
ncbi:MAG: 5-formyltetrahydrofolate cyclo-ligase [Lachnospirales bacterium]